MNHLSSAGTTIAATPVVDSPLTDSVDSFHPYRDSDPNLHCATKSYEGDPVVVVRMHRRLVVVLLLVVPVDHHTSTTTTESTIIYYLHQHDKDVTRERLLLLLLLFQSSSPSSATDECRYSRLPTVGRKPPATGSREDAD